MDLTAGAERSEHRPRMEPLPGIISGSAARSPSFVCCLIPILLPSAFPPWNRRSPPPALGQRRDKNELLRHRKLGASWEGLAIETVIRHHRAGEGECYFWSTYGRAELDLLIVAEGKRIGYEVKYTETPRATRSMQTARAELGLDDLRVVYPGERCFPLAEGIDAIGLAALPTREAAAPN